MNGNQSATCLVMAAAAVAITGCGSTGNTAPSRDAGRIVATLDDAAVPVPACNAGGPVWTYVPLNPDDVKIGADAVFVVGHSGDPNDTTSGLYRLPKDLSTATLLIGGGVGPIALDGHDVYIIAQFNGALDVLTAAQSWGSISPLVSGIAAPETVDWPTPAIVVSDDAVFVSSLGSVVSIPKAGGPLHTVVTAKAPIVFGADVARVYWTEYNGDGSIHATSLFTGADVTLASGTWHLVVGNELVFGDARSAWSMPTTGGPRTELATFGAHCCGGVATDGTWLYLDDGPEFVRFPLGGGPVQGVAPPPGDGFAQSYGAVAVDDVSFYWIEYGEGVSRLGRTCK